MRVKQSQPKPVPLDKQSYTTGQLARLLEVAARTVSKWVDGGLLKAHRIGTGGQHAGDRRIHRDSIIAFCEGRGIPCPLTAARRLLLVDPSPAVADAVSGLGAGWVVRTAGTAVGAAAAIVQWRPSAVLIDTRTGVSAATELAALAGTVADVRRVVAVAHDDGPATVPGCSAVVWLPCDPEYLLDALGVGGA